MSIDLSMSDLIYHNHHALSSTQVRQILDSPARYKWQLTQPPRTSDAFELGHAVHAKVLGVGGGIVEYPAEHLTASGAVSTKAATVAWADGQRNAGYIPITTAQARQVDAMAEAVLAHAEARALFEQPGHPEASVFATCDETAIEMRARFDYLPASVTDRPYGSGDPVAVDLKTTRGRATPRDFGRSIHDYRYDVQQGHYLETLRLQTGRDDVQMRFVVVEKAAPYFVAVHQLDDLYAAIGHDDARRARHTLRECIDTDTWPTGLEDIQYIDAPTWLIDDDIQIGA